MAKLRALRDEKEIAAIPGTEPVLIELDAAPSNSEPGGQEEDKTPVRAQDEPDEVATLKEQIAAHVTASAANQAKLDAVERERHAALRIADERTQELERVRSQAEQSEVDSITRGLAAAQAEQQSAQAELTRAFETGDGAAMGAAQAKIARAAATIVQYEQSAAQVASAKKTVIEQPQQQRQPVNDDPMSTLDTNPAITPAERTWIKSHPEVWIDPRRNQELGVAYDRAIRAGHPRGTDGYFKFLNEFMGYAKTEQSDDNERQINVAAPVSRETPSGGGPRTNGSKVTLSPEQREIARNMGISEIDYARGVLRLGEEKKANPEKFFSRG